MNWIYLDNNATTRPAPQVVDTMRDAQEQLWANASSVHRFGQMVRRRVELARASVAKLIGGREREIIFTSGGTESNNLALRGVLEAASRARDGRRKVLITTGVEHSAVREPAEALAQSGVEVTWLPLGRDARVDPAELTKALEQQARDDGLALVSIQWVNNETGVIQPIDTLVAVCQQFRDRGGRVLMHVDATQAVGKMPIDVGAVRVDLMTLSAHKFHGPKSVGGLYVRSGVRLRRQILGGPQEREKRGGTENTVGIIGAGVAADLARSLLADTAEIEKRRAMRDRFEQAICEALPDAVVNPTSAAPVTRALGGDPRDDNRIWNTSNIGFPGIEAEAILLGLSERGVCASAGAACSSGSLEPSPVLLAMGIPEPVAHGSIRFSLSRDTTDQELVEAARIVPQVVSRLAQTMPMTV